jgi:arylsulfatase A-like enzyme
MESGKKFFLITIDDLRRDRTSLEMDRDTTPFLRRFASENFYQESHFSNAPASPMSFRSMFSSTYPSEFSDNEYLSEGRPYLPRILSEKGVKTVGLTTNPFISTSYGFEKGYDIFDDTVVQGLDTKDRKFIDEVRSGLKTVLRKLPVKNTLRVMRDRFRGRSTPYMEAEDVTERAKSLIETEDVDGDSFYWFHYMDPHSPFIPPEETYGKWNSFGSKRKAWQAVDNGEEGVIDLYDECILYMDRYLGNLVEFIEEKFEDEEYEILITSDHGELFEVDNHKFTGHPEILEQKLLEVPLFMKNSPSRENFSTHTDIAPTVLDFFDLDITDKMHGESLYSSERNYDFAHSQPMYWEEMTDEQREARAGKITEEGIEETASLIGKASEDLGNKLKEHIERIDYSPEGEENSEKSGLSEEEEEKVKENLRQLGYDE